MQRSIVVLATRKAVRPLAVDRETGSLSGFFRGSTSPRGDEETSRIELEIMGAQPRGDAEATV